MIKVKKNVTKSVDTICDIWYYIFVAKREAQKKGENSMSKKGNKKDKHDINTIALVTALINLIIALIDLIKDLIN